MSVNQSSTIHMHPQGRGCIWISFRSSPPELFLEKDVLKICSKFTGDHSCRSAISIKLLPFAAPLL